MYRRAKLLERANNIVEKVLDKILRKILTLDDMHFGFMPGKDTIDAVFILRRKQEEYLAKQKKLHMCFVDQEKAFNRVPRKVVEWAMRKKGIPGALVTALMSLYKGARTKTKVGIRLSEELEVNVGVHQRSAYPSLLFFIVIDIATNEIKYGTLQEILYIDDLVLIAETMAEQRKKFILGKEYLRVRARK